MKNLPERIRAEVKFTTAEHLAVPARELHSLRSAGATGILAVIFRSGEDATDGRWILIDAASLPRNGSGDWSGTRDEAIRASRSDTALASFRESVDRVWARFLEAFLEVALLGQGPLKARLGERPVPLGAHDVLAAEHLGHIDAIIEGHGESVAGGVFQILFAHLLGHLGYREVTLNPVGVPDVEASLGAPAPAEPILPLTGFTPDELARIAALCRAAGERALADRIDSRGMR